jgi:hypothetical protein
MSEEKKQNTFKELFVLVFSIKLQLLLFFLFSFTLLYLPTYFAITNTQQVQIGEKLCVKAPFYFQERIRTNNTSWIKEYKPNIQEQVDSFFNKEICFNRIEVAYTNSENIPLYLRIFGNYELPIGTTSIQFDNPKLEISAPPVSENFIRVNLKNTSNFLEYTMTVDEKNILCTNSKDRNTICEVLISNKTNGLNYIPHNITIQTKNNYFEIPDLFKALLIENPDKSFEYIYSSDNPSTFCSDKKECVIGSTVLNKNLTARVFGSGENRIFLFGAIHGSEQNSAETMFQLINAIEAKQIKIPSDKQVIILPSLNLDSYTSNERLNENKVDLNRNFDTKDWVADTFLTDNQTFKNGGGSKPFSEPETQAVSKLIETVNPYITVSYHSWGKYVIPNSTELALEMGLKYSQLSKYVYSDPAIENTGFNYVATGTINTWGDENNYNIITIELSDLINHDFDKNIDAIQMLINWKL